MADGDAEPGFEFAQFETVLACAAGIADRKRGTFIARLKQWQKMGFPEVEKTGRGKRATYRFDDILKVQTLIALLDLGTTPERGIALVRSHWPKFRAGYIDSFDRVAKGDAEPVYAIVHLQALQELTGRATTQVNSINARHLSVLGWNPAIDGRKPEWLPLVHKDRISIIAFQEQVRNAFTGGLVVELTMHAVQVLEGIQFQLQLPLSTFKPAWERLVAEDEAWLSGFSTAPVPSEVQRRLELGRSGWLDIAKGAANDLTGGGVDVDPQA